jgi:hypothetical protein
MSAAVYVLNFYSPVFIDQLKRGRKTATIRLGDKAAKYKKGHVVLVTVGFQHSPREKIFEAVVDAVDVKKVSELSPRDIEHDNPEFRRVEETVHFLEQIYGREVSHDELVTVVRFSAILERPSEMADRLRPEAPSQN